MKTRILTIRKPQYLLTAGLWFAFVLSGCEDPAYKYERELENRNGQANAKIAQLEKQVSTLKAQVKTKDEQIKNLQGMDKNRLDSLVKVDGIKISSYTGGVSRNGQSGQDSIKVIFNPIDKDGDKLKAAGNVSISLFDLKAKTRNKLAIFDFTPHEALKNWAGGPLTNHYSFTLPLPKTFKGGQVTVLVIFTDILTGKSHSAQRICKIVQ